LQMSTGLIMMVVYVKKAEKAILLCLYETQPSVNYSAKTYAMLM
jgi:hypothetical protein